MVLFGDPREILKMCSMPRNLPLIFFSRSSYRPPSSYSQLLDHVFQRWKILIWLSIFFCPSENQSTMTMVTERQRRNTRHMVRGLTPYQPNPWPYLFSFSNYAGSTWVVNVFLCCVCVCVWSFQPRMTGMEPRDKPQGRPLPPELPIRLTGNTPIDSTELRSSSHPTPACNALPWLPPVYHGSSRFKQPDKSNCPFLFLVWSFSTLDFYKKENQELNRNWFWDLTANPKAGF